MRLLLTSSGINNPTIQDGFISLLEKPIAETIVAFIPTAANVENDREWVYEEMDVLKHTGVKELIDVDIEKLTKDVWFPALKRADVIYFGGGNTYFLLYWIKKSGLVRELNDLLSTRLYVGSSAGSIVAGPTIELNRDFLPDEIPPEGIDLTGLQYVDFITVPHLNSKILSNADEKQVRSMSTKISCRVYAIDDNSAIKVTDKYVEVISEGQWFISNEAK